MTPTETSGNDLPEQVDVVIAGGGPVGLSLLYLLGRYGVNALLLEKRPDYATIYKGPGIHPSTAELWRNWGVLDRLEATDHGDNFDIYQTPEVSLWGTFAEGRLVTGVGLSQEELKKATDFVSPETWLFTAPWFYEQIIDEQAAAWPTARSVFGVEVTGVENREGAAIVSAVDRRGDAELPVQIQAKYVIAADGAPSTIRTALGVKQIYGKIPDEPQVGVSFVGSLEKYGVTSFQNIILGPQNRSYIARQPKHPQVPARADEWNLTFWNRDGHRVTEEEALQRVRDAIGDPHFEAEITRFGHFTQRAVLTEKWRVGRVFFAGDANHQHSPWGGFGANLGTAEANNLAWKIAAVLHGDAAESLLDTYERERRAAAVRIIRLTTYNDAVWKNLENAYGELAEFDPDRTVTSTFFPPLAQGGAHEISGFSFQFAANYVSEAVVNEPGPFEASTSPYDYKKSGVPGVRAPHVWLVNRAGSRTSTVRLFGSEFVLLVSGKSDAWRSAVAVFPGEGVSGVVIHEIDAGGVGWQSEAEKFGETYGLAEGGAVLIRPDGIIGARFVDHVQDAGAALSGAVGTILGN